MEFLKILV